MDDEHVWAGKVEGGSLLVAHEGKPAGGVGMDVVSVKREAGHGCGVFCWCVAIVVAVIFMLISCPSMLVVAGAYT